MRYALQGTIREIGNVDGRQLLYIDVGRSLTAKTTLDAVEKLGLEVGDEVALLRKLGQQRFARVHCCRECVGHRGTV